MAVISPLSSPPPSPTCRPSPLARHHITTETAALSLTPPQRPCHHPNHGRYSHRHLNCHHPNHRRHPSHCHHPNCGRSHRSPTITASTTTPIPSPPLHPLLPCPLYHLAPTCSTTPPTLGLVPCIYLNAKYIIIFYA